MAKLILGTAEFGPKAYATAKEPLSLNLIRIIMNAAHHYGITTLEGAEDYHCDEVLKDLRFELIYKVRHPYNIHQVLENTGRRNLLGLMYHHWPTDRASQVMKHPALSYTGSSVYTHGQVSSSDEMVEVPLNLENKTFEKMTAPCKLVRSVFNRGELLKTKTVKECLDYVKSLPNIHGVVVGVNSVAELEEIVKQWHS